MSLIPVQPSYALQTPSKVTKANGSDRSGAASGDGSVTDTVHLSNHGKIMSKLSVLMPPTADNVRKLTAALAVDLKSLFRDTTIDAQRGVGIEVDSQTGQVSVQGGRPDTKGIAALIGSQPGIARQIQDISTLSAHVVASEQGAATSQANQAAQRAAQIGSVFAEYASRFSDNNEIQNPSLTPIQRGGNAGGVDRRISAYAATSGASGTAGDISIIFNGAEIQIDVNGRPWISSRA